MGCQLVPATTQGHRHECKVSITLISQKRTRQKKTKLDRKTCRPPRQTMRSRKFYEEHEISEILVGKLSRGVQATVFRLIPPTSSLTSTHFITITPSTSFSIAILRSKCTTQTCSVKVIAVYLYCLRTWHTDRKAAVLKAFTLLIDYDSCLEDPE